MYSSNLNALLFRLLIGFLEAPADAAFGMALGRVEVLARDLKYFTPVLKLSLSDFFIEPCCLLGRRLSAGVAGNDVDGVASSEFGAECALLPAAWLDFLFLFEQLLVRCEWWMLDTSDGTRLILVDLLFGELL